MFIGAILFALSIRVIVVDPSNLPLAGAKVEIKGTSFAGFTGDDGALTIPAPAAFPITLVVSMTGFAVREVVVETFEPAILLRVQLQLAPVTEEVSVQGRPITGIEQTGYTVPTLETIRTPGSQADLFRALHVLPGVVQIDEGAGLFVRGGDVNELLVLLDGAIVAHPYRYETPTGGFRGAVDPFMTEGIAFSTGGFSAKYGNVLSGVLDLRAMSKPENRRLTVTAGLAGISGSLAQPVGANAGFHLSVNRVLPKLLFALNPPPQQFDRYPGGWDVAGNVSHASKLGVTKIVVLEQRDHVGVEIEKDAFRGFLHSGALHRLISGNWKRAISERWRAEAAFGYDRHVQSMDVGSMAIGHTDRRRSGRIDLEGLIGRWTLRTGVDAAAARTSIEGRAPLHGGDFGAVAGSADFFVRHHDWYAGAYLEGASTFGRFTPSVGARIDRYKLAKTTTRDPRLSIGIEMTQSQRIRLAWGVYHQSPSAGYYDTVRGASQLPPMRAVHYIASYEFGAPQSATFIRAEAYYKTYRDLPLEDKEHGYSSDGFGVSSGVDFFARRHWNRVEVRGSASWLSARRRWTSIDQRERYSLPTGTWTPDFSIPISGQVVTNVAVAGPLSVAVSWRAASGRPETPVLGAIPSTRGHEPIFGPINSERLPHYQRLDLSSSVMAPFPGGVMIVFVSVDNTFGRRNFFEYAYTPDYSSRQPIITTSPRSYYFGFSILR